MHFSLDLGLVKQLRRPTELRGLEAQVAREHDGIDTLRVREKVKKKTRKGHKKGQEQKKDHIKLSFPRAIPGIKDGTIRSHQYKSHVCHEKEIVIHAMQSEPFAC